MPSFVYFFGMEMEPLYENQMNIYYPHNPWLEFTPLRIETHRMGIFAVKLFVLMFFELGDTMLGHTHMYCRQITNWSSSSLRINICPMVFAYENGLLTESFRVLVLQFHLTINTLQRLILKILLHDTHIALNRGSNDYNDILICMRMVECPGVTGG